MDFATNLQERGSTMTWCFQLWNMLMRDMPLSWFLLPRQWFLFPRQNYGLLVLHCSSYTAS